MAALSFAHAEEVRAALGAIVSDPAHGLDALSSPRVMESLLSDLLPDAPRESGLLVAAVQKDVSGMLRKHVANGLAAEVAVNLAASSFADSTAFLPEACRWITGELAIALGLALPGGLSGVGLPRTATVVAGTAESAEQPPPAEHNSRPPGVLALVAARPGGGDGRAVPQAGRPTRVPAGLPQPPQEGHWRLATPLPEPYGTRDCPRCGRSLPRASRGKPHTAPGHLWCPGIPGISYFNRDGYIWQGDPPDDLLPEPAIEHPDEPSAPQGAAATRLTELARLHDAGLLTDQEFQEKRREIIRQL